jgi:hypothetical protein
MPASFGAPDVFGVPDSSRAPEHHAGVPPYLATILHPTGHTPIGTCFQPAPGVLATACHVLADHGMAAPGAEVPFARPAGGPQGTAVVERLDVLQDLALLRTDTPLPASVRGVAPTAWVPRGTEVVVQGFAELPGNLGAKAYQYLQAGGEWEGTSPRLDGARVGRFSSKDLLRGMSGAPVRRASDDAVVGVVRGRYNSVDGWFRDSVWTAWTEDLAALAPWELSWFSPHLRTHEQALRELAGTERYLTQQQLEFVSPGARSAAAPERLLNQLDAQFEPGGIAEPKRGVLLEGVAGAGKTRTCYEVADRARGRDWLVLHTTPTSMVTGDELVRAALEHARLAGADRVLLVLDYLDSYSRLIVPDLSRPLQEHDPQGRVALLASVRPGALKGAEREAEGLFTRVRLEEGREYRVRVATGIFQKVAPVALRRWGDEELVSACSDRPVLALLIARALEEQARAVRDAPDLSDLRLDDLFSWLRRRLEKDFGAPTAADRTTGDTRPHTRLLAATVALLACPQDAAAVEAAVDRALARRADEEFALLGHSVVELLRDHGWLLGGAAGGRLDLVHDIVADGLLGACLVPGPTVQSRTVGELLDALLDDTGQSDEAEPVFTQAVRHLSRWTTDQDDRVRAGVEEACARWLERRAETIGELLTADPPAGTAYDLMARTPWQPGMLRLWDRLVAPWLHRIEEQRPADLPAVLAQAVDKITGPLPAQLVHAALTCLEARPAALETGALLQALLHAEGLTPQQTATVADRVPDWARRHQRERRAALLLAAALGHPDLTPETAGRLREAAWRWTRDNEHHSAGSLVLAALLDREGELGPSAEAVRDAALTWVVRQSGNPGVSFVLPRLLRRTDLGVHRNRVVGLALAWLHRRRNRPNRQGSFVLRPLLQRADLTEEEAAAAVGHARKWLELNPDEPHEFVLGALLRWDRSAEERVTELLRQEPVPESRRHLLAELLRDHLPRGLRREVADASLRWLREFGMRPDSELLHWLLRAVSPPGEAWADASALAVRWLRRYGPVPEASFLLDDLLSAEPDRPETVQLALEWLEEHALAPDASYVLRPLLWHHHRLADDHPDETVRHALHWLAKHAASDDAGFVLEPLLSLSSLGPGVAGRALEAAGVWLEGHAEAPNADRLLRPLLAREDLPSALRTRAENLAAAWIARHPGRRTPLLPVLLAAPGPGPECAIALVPHVLAEPLEGKHAVGILNGLLYSVPSGTEQRTALIEYTLDWVAGPGPLNKRRDQVLRHLLAQRDLTGPQLDRAAGLCMADGKVRPYTLAELLRHARWRETAASRALEWLPGNSTRSSSDQLLLALLRPPGPPRDRDGDVRRWTREWLEANGPGHWSWQPLTEALRQAESAGEKTDGGPHDRSV